MGDKADVWQGTLALMVLRTLQTMGPQHGYGIARRIEQTSGGQLALNYGTLYPVLVKLEQEGAVAVEWGLSENNRKAKFYRLTAAGRRRAAREAREWQQATAILRELGFDGLSSAKAYLLTGVQRGEEFCGVRPEDALPVILGRGRTPLTIDEGIAVVAQAPHLLEKNKCFMLSGSRRSDRRVPAMWISEGAPKLGWCWDGNPHSWLGVASAAGRLAT